MPEIEDLPPSTAKSFSKQYWGILSSPTANLSHLRILVVLIYRIFFNFFLFSLTSLTSKRKGNTIMLVKFQGGRKIQLTLNALFRSSAHNVSRKRCRFSSNVRMNSKIWWYTEEQTASTSAAPQVRKKKIRPVHTHGKHTNSTAKWIKCRWWGWSATPILPLTILVSKSNNNPPHQNNCTRKNTLYLLEVSPCFFFSGLSPLQRCLRVCTENLVSCRQTVI